METEYQVRFLGCSEHQAKWGKKYGDHSKLEIGKIYTVIKKYTQFILNYISLKQVKVIILYVLNEFKLI